MRIAYVCADPGIPVFGTKGASVHVQELVRTWHRRGDQVTVYCTRLGEHVPADLAGLPVVCDPVVKGGDAADRERGQAEAAARLAKLALADGVDLVHERYSLFSTALADMTAQSGVPGLLEVNAPLIDEQRTHRTLVDAAGAGAALERQVLAARRVCCVSREVADWVGATLGQQAEIADIVVTPNGVDPERFAAAAHTEPALDPPVVVFVGTLKPWHGVEILLDAAAIARTRWRLRIVGDGPLAGSLRERAGTLGLDVDFRGAVAPEAVPAHLADCLVAVAPYPADDNHYFSPLKVYEAAAAGLPVVATAVGQIPGIVEHGRTGLLVPPSRPVELAAAVDALVADPERARRLGRAGRDVVRRRHTWDQVLAAGLAGVLR